MSLIGFHLLTIVSLVFLFFTATTLYGVKRFRSEFVDLFLEENPPLYLRIHKYLFGTSLTSLIFSLTITVYAFTVLFLGAYLIPIGSILLLEKEFPVTNGFLALLSLFVLLSALIFFVDTIPRKWSASRKEIPLLALTFATFPLIVTVPLAFLFHHFFRFTGLDTYLFPKKEDIRASQDMLLELIEEADSAQTINIHDKKLLQAVVNFRDRIAREVMVPRISLFCLEDTVSIEQAVLILEKENYSRIPVFRDTVDTVIGVLMYKDLLFSYVSKPEERSKPVRTVIKNVMYIPETKKLSQLLQEFRRGKKHMAIVVDEYGGTSGIVTIEDILEEIVGEIADEYDEEAALFKNIGPNMWIVDARINLVDLYEETGIEIPQEEEYDTIAGFLFHCLGIIPEKKTVVHRDTFDIEVISSNDRSVEKVRITSFKKGNS